MGVGHEGTPSFAPDIATAFYRAVEDGDRARLEALLTDFYVPLVELRDKVPGYAVSLVKAATRLSGIDTGTVRAPLIEAKAEHVAELERIIAAGRSLAK